jgi:hypothetical protein
MEEHSWGVIVGCGCEGFQWFDVEVVPSVLEPSAWWRAHGKSMFNGNIGINGKFHPEAYESTGSSKLLQGQYVYEVNAKTNRKSISTLKPSLKPWETSDGQFLVLIIPSNGNLIIITLYEDEPKLFAKILSTFNYK